MSRPKPQPLSEGAVRYRKDTSKRGGTLALLRFFDHFGEEHRKQAWGRTQPEAKKAVEAVRNTVLAETQVLHLTGPQEPEEENPLDVPLNLPMQAVFEAWVLWLAERTEHADGDPDREAQTVQESSAGTYVRMWNGNCKERLGKVRIDNLRIGHLTRTLQVIEDRGSDPYYVRHMLASLMGWAVQNGYRADERDVAKGLVGWSDRAVRPRQKRAVTEPEHWSLHKAATEVYLNSSSPAANNNLADLLLLLWYVGCRVGEATGLVWSRVHLDAQHPYVVIDSTITYRRRKNEDGSVQYVEARKERRKKSQPPFRVLLSPEAVAMLRRRQERGWRTKPDDFVFAVKKTGRHVQPGNLRTRLLAITKGTEYEGITPHSYKRAWGTAAAKQYGNAVAAEFLGDSLAVAELHYIMVDGEKVLDPTAFRVTGEDPDEGQSHLSAVS